MDAKKHKQIVEELPAPEESESVDSDGTEQEECEDSEKVGEEPEISEEIEQEEPEIKTEDNSESEAVLLEELERQTIIAKVREEKQKQEYEDTLARLYIYADVTFRKILTPSQRRTLKNNLINLSQRIMVFEPVESHSSSHVTSLDLNHFGWNIGQRMKIPGCKPRQQNTEIAQFLKESFICTFENSELKTIATKLSYEDGKFTLPKVKIDEELRAHVFPGTEDLPDKTD